MRFLTCQQRRHQGVSAVAMTVHMSIEAQQPHPSQGSSLSDTDPGCAIMYSLQPDDAWTGNRGWGRT